eukprot:3887765-Pyramimonas_sp.AAC.1
MFHNACTIREYKLQAGIKDDHPCVSPLLRGASAVNVFACLQDAEWFDQLQRDDCVIAHAPDTAQSGCFPEWKWISLPHYDD